MFVQVDYAFEDIKNSIATTDTFIDFYMPHKINKSTVKILQQLYSAGVEKQGDEQRDILLRQIEEQQQKELYLRMLTTNDKKQPEANFKDQIQKMD